MVSLLPGYSFLFWLSTSDQVLKCIDISGDHGHTHVGQEFLVLMVMPWMTFLIGEISGLSGIVCILFCGVAIAHYGKSNMSQLSVTVIDSVYHSIGSYFENIIFIFIGIGLFGFVSKHELPPEYSDETNPPADYEYFPFIF